MGCPNAIKPVRAVCLQGFAEMNQSIGQHHALQWHPNRLCQISGGFHYDGNIGCAGDIKPKLIALHSKISAAGLNNRVPQNGSNHRIGREFSPTGRARQRDGLPDYTDYGRVSFPRYCGAV